MAVLSFRFDESCKGRSMAVGGWLAEEREWNRLENQWQKCINRQNSGARADQQITRYHAQPMNGSYNEFEQWDRHMKEKFGKKLMAILMRRKIGAICCGVDMDALKEIFPDNEPTNADRAYQMCIRVIMVELAHVMKDYRPGDRVAIIHDRGNWDSQALEAFNQIVSDKTWPFHDLFVSITPMAGPDCVGLQAADLITFETRCLLDKKMVNSDAELRWALKEFDKNGVPSIMKYVNKKTIEFMRDTVGRGIYDQR